jgi:glycerophosphoryl diester phosphodiesterase
VSGFPAPNAPAWLTARPIAHRGLHDRDAGVIENGIAAAHAAINAGYAIECDVQGTADGEVVVFHDHTLERLTGETGTVGARSLAQLAALELTGGGEKIPSLAQFLQTVSGRTPLVVEIKSRFDGDPAAARRTLATLESYDGPVCVKSFDPDTVALLRAEAPHLPRGIVAQADFGDEDRISRERLREMENLLHFPRTQPDFVSWHVGDLPHAAPFLCRTLRGMPLMTWTVRDAETARAALAHADQIVFEGFEPQLR